jgi:hypothetical protein
VKYGSTPRFTAALFLCSALFSAPDIAADLVTTAEITGTATLLHEEEQNFSLLSYGKGSLDLKSFGNKNVRGQLQIETLISEDIILDVSRAFMKVRFPGFRLTLGRTRVSWGDGFLFNAADVVFEGMNLLTDLSEVELRDETDWMLIPYLPLGTFSFVEGLVLPHPRLTQDTGIPVSVALEDVDVGARLVTKLMKHKIEAGYLYKGSLQSHRPYASFQGNLLGFEWNLSTSLSIPTTNPEARDLREGWDLSFGFFRFVTLPSQGTLLFRIESGIRPFGEWQELTPAPSEVEYGLYLFPEISYSPTDGMSLYLRSIISPVDLSALTFAGFRWNMYQGFTMHFLVFFMLGDEDDQFGWNRFGDMGFSSESGYIFGSRF